MASPAPTAPVAPRWKAQWPGAVLSVLIGIFGLCLAWPQIFPGPSQANQMTLPNLDKRATMLEQVTDPVQREQYCIGLAAYGRALDRAIPTNARVFLSGMLGETNAGRLGYYYFLRNYLFPRDLDISLGQPATFAEYWADGVPCDSAEVLRTNGFDLFLKFGDDGRISIIPLTQKGMPRQ